MLAGRGQDPLVSALTHNFEIETGSDADTDTARRLGHQIVDFRIVGVEALHRRSAVGSATVLFTERIFKAHNSIGQFAPHWRPDVNNRSIHPHRIHDRDE